MRAVGVVAIVLCLAACETPYREQETGVAGLLLQNTVFGGGVRATRIGENVYLVSASGNNWTSADTVTQHVLRKAAELTIEAGYDVFLVNDRQDQTRTSTVVSPGSSTTTAMATGFGNTATGTAYTTYSPATVRTLIRPGESARISMFKGPMPPYAPDNVYDARELLKYLAPAK